MKQFASVRFNGIVLLLLFSVCSLYSNVSERISITHYGFEDGVYQGNVPTIAQDKKGFIWAATWDGLARFDGYRFRTFKTLPGDGSGVASNRFQAFSIDAKGNFWCRTEYGIVHFDTEQYRFTDMGTAMGVPHFFSGKKTQIKTLNKDVVWVKCSNDEYVRFDLNLPFKEGVEVFSTERKSFGSSTRYNLLYEDLSGNEWMLTDRGIYSMDGRSSGVDADFRSVAEVNGKLFLSTKDNRFGFLQLPELRFQELFLSLPPGTRINALHRVNDECLTISTDGEGALLFDVRSKELTPLRFTGVGGSPRNVVGCYTDSRQTIWLQTLTQGLYSYDLTTRKQHYFSLSNRSAGNVPRYGFYEDSNHNLWISPPNRMLFCYNPVDGSMTSVAEMLNKFDDPSISFVSGNTVDRQGNLWVSTHYRGIEKISFSDRKYNFTPMQESSMVRAAMVDREKRTWVASTDGKVTLLDVWGKPIGSLSSQGVVGANHNFGCKLYSMFQDSKGRIWLGSRESGLFLLRPSDNNRYRITSFKADKQDPYGLNGNAIYSIFEDKDNRIWIGSYDGGLHRIEEGSGGEIRFVGVHNDFTSTDVQQALHIRCIAQTQEGVMLFGCSEGLLVGYTVDGKERFKLFNRKADDSNSLRDNYILGIAVTPENDIYLTSLGGGIHRCRLSFKENEPDLKIRSFDRTDGLASDQCYGVLLDHEGQIWAVSHYALSRYSPQEERFEVYGRNFFDQKINFSEAQPIITPNGELFFGCFSGFLTLDLDKLHKSTFVPSIRFLSLEINNQELSDSDSRKIDVVDRLVLQSDERNIVIHFAALDYLAPDNIRYAYRLKGLEEKWTFTGINHSAVYTNLPPGEFVFEVRSTNSDGAWVENLRILPVEVKPQFLETFWAWFLVALLIVGVIGAALYFYLTIYKLRHQVEMEEQLTHLKLQFFTDISHELRTPLTLISTPIEEVMEDPSLNDRSRRNLTVAQNNVDRMLSLINQILDFRKVQNHKMRLSLERTDVLPFLDRLMENFRAVAEERHIRFELQTSLSEAILWIDRDKFEKIVFNLLSNAFKFTDKEKKIRLTVRQNETRIAVVVEDQGLGIDRELMSRLFNRFESTLRSKQPNVQPSSGIGLSLVKSLVELHHGEIKVESEEGKGSRFTVLFHQGIEHFKGDTYVDYPVGERIVEERSDDLPIEENSESDLMLLIVEDNEELRRFLIEALGGTYRVAEAENGQVGLDRTRELLPDLILSDVMMPVMDGLEMIERIKADVDLCHIPILVLSAKSSIDDRIKGLESGIDDYLPKPFSIQYLRAKIASVLNREMERREYYRQCCLDPNRSVKVDELSVARPLIHNLDEKLIDKLLLVLEREMSNSELEIEEIASELCLSRTVFYKKIKSITGLAPVDFVRKIRIKRAVQLIEIGQYTISEVAYQVGFTSSRYFSKCFKAEMGVTPSNYKQG